MYILYIIENDDNYDDSDDDDGDDGKERLIFGCFLSVPGQTQIVCVHLTTATIPREKQQQQLQNAILCIAPLLLVLLFSSLFPSVWDI